MGTIGPACGQQFARSSAVCVGMRSNSSGGPGRVGGTCRRSASSAAAAKKADQMGSVWILSLTRNMNATCNRIGKLMQAMAHTSTCNMHDEQRP